jgi:PAS domain S-box-containing protein
VRDETGSHREQFSLRQRLDLFERMFRASPVASTLVALADGRHIDVNDAWIRLFGRLREEIVGRTGVAAGIWSDPVRHQALLATLRECGRARGFRARLRRADGEAIDAEISAESLTLDGEQCVLWKVVDVTRELRAAAEIRRLNQTLEARVAERTEQLNAANEALQAFSYSVSHDLRAPARRMRSFAALAVDALRQGDTAAALGALERIERSGANLEHLVEALMTLSQVGRKTPEPCRVDLSRIAADVLDELRAADAHRVVDGVTTPGLNATADPVLARVLLQNLLSNAWKYTRDAARARIEFTQVQTPGGAAFCVRDNGAGFDPAYSSRLFRPFSRLHSESEFPGSGIGLATVARIVASHGGKVWAEGRPGEGASFYFTLPERNARDVENAERADS